MWRGILGYGAAPRLISPRSSVIHQDGLCNLQRVPDAAETETINPSAGKENQRERRDW